MCCAASRATTIDVPGLTKSKVSPDGRIASRDLGSKLVCFVRRDDNCG